MIVSVIRFGRHCARRGAPSSKAVRACADADARVGGRVWRRLSQNRCGAWVFAWRVRRVVQEVVVGSGSRSPGVKFPPFVSLVKKLGSLIARSKKVRGAMFSFRQWVRTRLMSALLICRSVGYGCSGMRRTIR